MHALRHSSCVLEVIVNMQGDSLSEFHGEKLSRTLDEEWLHAGAYFDIPESSGPFSKIDLVSLKATSRSAQGPVPA
eukprot:410264-Pelagomonas_calceolata.AAC.1